jgi:hypothetical protein
MKRNFFFFFQIQNDNYQFDIGTVKFFRHNFSKKSDDILTKVTLSKIKI